MGVEVRVEGLTKSFGKQLIWGDVKSVFLKTLVGLLKPDRGEIWIERQIAFPLHEHTKKTEGGRPARAPYPIFRPRRS